LPELPEVETTVRDLRPSLRGRRVARAWMRHRSLYRRESLSLHGLIGRSFDRVERVGKNAVFFFRPSGIVLVNHGMTGRLVVWEGGKEPDGLSPRHLHMRLTLADTGELRFYDARRFGHIFVAEGVDFARDLGIGPDPFEADEPYLRNALRGRSAAVKSLLLDQRILSGIGNIYADETLFYAGIDPRRAGGTVVRRVPGILACAREVLQRAIDHGGSTLRDYRRGDGSPGSFQDHHAVYGRAGKACPRCGRRIRRIVLSGRGTHFCSRCQR
jgi:formamidopyrimidine-DNA glycosylase